MDNAWIEKLANVFLTVSVMLLMVGVSLAPASAKMQMTSQAFTHNSAIPQQYTCDGKDTTPRMET